MVQVKVFWGSEAQGLQEVDQGHFARWLHKSEEEISLGLQPSLVGSCQSQVRSFLVGSIPLSIFWSTLPGLRSIRRSNVGTALVHCCDSLDPMQAVSERGFVV